MDPMDPSASKQTLHGLSLDDFAHLETILSHFTHATGRCAVAILREYTLTRKDHQ